MNFLNTFFFLILLFFLNKKFRKITKNFFSNKYFFKINNFFILFIILNICFLVIFATKYLISDFYLDHVEPQIATVSWFFEYGKEIYNKTTDYERYSLIFGPITYYSNYIAMKFLGASIISSKVVSFLFLNLTLLISYLTVLKITKNTKFSLFLTGFISMIFLSTVAAPLRISNDSLAYFLISLSLYFCTYKEYSLNKIIFFSISLILLINIKPNLILAILPSFFYLYLKNEQKIKDILLATLISLTFFFFIWSSDYFSIVNYISWIKVISQSEYQNGFNINMFLKNISFSLIWIIPLIIINYEDSKKINYSEKLFFFILIFSSIILSLTGSRDGGGTAELFSLTLPAVFLFSQSYKRKTFILNKELVGFHFSLLILLTIVFLHSSTKGLLKKVKFLNNNNYSYHIDELKEILSDYKYKSINMGYGSNYNSYLISYLRPILTFNNKNFVLDVPHLIVTTHSVPLKEEFLKNCYNQVYVFTKNDEPFSSKYWEREIFNKKFINNFKENFYKQKTYNFFETWTCKK